MTRTTPPRPRSFTKTAVRLTLGGLLFASTSTGCTGDADPGRSTTPDAAVVVDASNKTDTATDRGGNPEAAPTALERVQAGVGDPTALAGLRALTLEVTGSSAAYDEGPMPADMPFASSDFKIVTQIDVAGGRLKLSHDKTYKLIRPGKAAKYDEIVVDKLGYIVGDERVTGGATNYTAKMSSARVASVRRQQTFLNPHLLLQKLGAADVSSGGTLDWGGRTHDRFVAKDPDKVQDLELLVDPTTGRLSALATKESDHLRGDVQVRFVYDRWEASGALFFPKKVTVEVEGHAVRVEERTAITVNPTLGNEVFMFPSADLPVHDETEHARGAKHAQSYQRFAAMGVSPSQEFPHANVKGVEMGAGSGVYHLIGSSHHSLLVDQGKTVVLVEAPNDAARSKAILAWIDKTLPGGLAENKVSHVILTHHHVDHSSGLRTFVAAGAIPVVAEESRALWNKVLAAPRTIDPDDLVGKATPAAGLVTVKLGEAFTLGNVSAHHIANRHSSDTLIIHVQSAGGPPVLFISDLYIPNTTGILAGSNFVLWSKDLDDALIAMKLNVPTLAILGGHGNVDGTGAHVPIPYSMFKAQLTAVAP